MGQPASQSRWEIASVTQGNKQLKRVQSSSCSSDAKREHVTAQGVDIPIGSVFTPGGDKINFTVFVEQSTPEVDYLKLFTSGEYFTLTRRIVGGKSYQYVNCQVFEKPAPSGDNSGAHTYTVVIGAEQELPL